MKRFMLALTILGISGTFAFAGAKGGQQVDSRVIGSKATLDYTITFYGGDPASVAVSGDHDSDLDLYIYDESGNLIVSDDDYTDNCLVSWTPRWTGAFTVRIVNRGYAANAFGLGTN